MRVLSGAYSTGLEEWLTKDVLPNIAESLGATFSDEERDGYMAVRRYASYLIGIPETILFHDESEALRLFDM